MGQQLAQEATRRARSWLADRKAIAGSRVEPILVAAARHGDASLFDALVKAVRTSKDRATVHAAAQTALNNLEEFGEATAEAQKTLAAANQATQLDPTLVAHIRIGYALSLTYRDKYAEAASQLDLVEKSGFLRRPTVDDTQARYWLVRGRVLGSNFQSKAATQAYGKALAIQDRMEQTDPVLRHQIIHAKHRQRA